MHEVVVIGAGFTGIGMAVALKREGRHDFAVLERSEDIGGTWRDDTDPACDGDLPSHIDPYSFEPFPVSSRIPATPSEIAEYLRHCADKYEVKPHVHFGAEAVSAVHDEPSATWTVTTAGGAVYLARSVVLAVGAFAVRTAEGRGDRAMTVSGRDGLRLADSRRGGAEAHLGIAVTGFPNLFGFGGADTGVGRGSLIERRIRYVTQALDLLGDAASIEVRADVPRVSDGGLRARLRRAVWSLGGFDSWYLDRRARARIRLPGSMWRARRPRAADFRIRPRD